MSLNLGTFEIQNELQRRGLLLLLISVLMVLVGVAAAYFLSNYHLGTRPLALAAMGTALVVPIGVKVASKTFDFFEPLTGTIMAFTILFFVRPLVDLDQNRLGYAGIDAESTYSTALATALAALLAFEAGYLLPIGRSLVAKLKMTTTLLQNESLVLYGVGLASIAVLFILARVVFPNVPAIFVASRLAVPACLILWSVRGRWEVTALVLSVIPLGAFLLTTLPEGNRRDFLLLLAAAGAWFYVRNGKRPSLAAVAVGILVAFFFVISPVRLSRASDLGYYDALVWGISHPTKSVTSLMQADDTVHISVLAYEIDLVGDGKSYPWQLGQSTLSETILQPIPQQIWQDKPETIRNQIIQDKWGMSHGVCLSLCPTFSAIGTLYADLGIPSVIAGCFVIGIVLKAWYEYFRKWRHLPAVQVLFSSSVFLSFYIWWDTLGFLVVQLATVIIPLLLALKLSSSVSSCSLPTTPLATSIGDPAPASPARSSLPSPRKERGRG